MKNKLPDFKRRTLLGGLSFFGLTSLTACIPVAPGGVQRRSAPEAGPIEETYQSALFSKTSLQSSLGVYNPQLSSKSQAVFRSILKHGVIPQSFDLPAEFQADGAIELFRKVKAKYENKKELELSETYEVVQHLIPLTRMFVDLNSISTAPRPASNENVTVSADGTLTIPPGYRVVSIQQGYCLDQPLPAPGREDKMSLLPSSNLIPRELLPLYRAIQDKAYKDKAYRDQMQKLMWTLRAAGQPNSLAVHVDLETLRNMDKAMPGGARAFADYHNSHIGGGNGSINLQQKNSAPSQTGPNESIAQKMFNAFMDGLTNSRSGPMEVAPDDNRNYQMLEPNVAVFSVGNKPLTPQIEIVNGGNEDFRINLADFVMQPAKKQQRVAMYPTRPENISYFKYGITPDSDSVEKLKRLKEKIDTAMLQEAARFLNDKLLKNVARSEIFRNFAFRLLKDSPATRILLGAIPILGNALSAYEAISGKNWINGRDLNAFERVASALGTIPGGGVLSSVFREKLVTRAGMIFAGAGFSVNQGLMEKEIAAYSQAYTNPIDFVADYAVDKIMSSINKGFVELSQDDSFSKRERASMLRYIANPHKAEY